MPHAISTETKLPIGWPAQLRSALVWDGSDYNNVKKYSYLLTDLDRQEIKDAIKSFKELGLDGSQVDRATFNLPHLGAQLEALAEELHTGRGFFVIQGVDPKDWSAEDNVLIMLGISVYIGETRGYQDDDGNMLVHIRDAKQMASLQEHRPVRNSKLSCQFHTDTFCDILAMQVRHNAAIGGTHKLASCWSIYNELAANRPEVIKLLAQSDWPFDLRGRLAINRVRPLLYYEDDRIILNVAPQALLGAADVVRMHDMPALRDEQIAALSAIQSTAMNYHLALETKPGDFIFVNNFAILHARDAFEDDKNNRRHLVRMWLKNKSLAWKLPCALKAGNSKVFEPDDTLAPRWEICPLEKLTYKIAERFVP